MMDHGYFDGPWERGARTDGDMTLLRRVADLKRIQRRIEAFLCKRYVQRADERQKRLGLQYMEAETSDLAWQLAKLFASAIEAQRDGTTKIGSAACCESAAPQEDAQND